MIYTVSDRETISDVSTSGGVGFTTTKLAPTGYTIHYAIVQAIDGDVRFTIDDTAPVADTTGQRLCQDDSVEVWGATAMSNFLAIDDGGTAKLEVIYMGVPA